MSIRNFRLENRSICTNVTIDLLEETLSDGSKTIWTVKVKQRSPTKRSTSILFDLMSENEAINFFDMLSDGRIQIS